MHTAGAPFISPMTVHFVVGTADQDWFWLCVLKMLLTLFTVQVFTLSEDTGGGRAATNLLQRFVLELWKHQWLYNLFNHFDKKHLCNYPLQTPPCPLAGEKKGGCFDGMLVVVHFLIARQLNIEFNDINAVIVSVF